MEGIGFLRPGLLWGLLGVAVPILIHLLGRRRVLTVPIGTLRFLERARARASSRWRLRRLLLLLARAAVAACLALLFAGPGCRERGAGPGSQAWILVLDTSPSMAASRGGVACLDRAKEQLLDVLNGAAPADRFLLATTRLGEESPWREGFSGDAAAVRKRIKAAAVGYGDHRTDRALERALRLLEGTPGGRVALATDLQASAWGEGPVPGAGKVTVRLLDAGLPDPRNAWVASVEESGGRVRATLASMGPADAGERRTVRLRLEDGQGATAFVTGSEASFQIRPPPGDHGGTVSVAPGGDLALDDAFPFVGRGKGKVRVLFVNGDPRGFEIRDELFFLRKALSPGGRLGEAFDVREVRAAELAPGDLDGVQVTLLANPGSLPEAVVGALQGALEKGAGLVVTAGDRWKPGQGAGALTRVLAAPLRDVITLAGGASRKPYEPIDADSLRPPLEGFRERSAGDLSGARIWSYWSLDEGRAGAVEIWMRLENGAPLLAHRRLGKGSSLLLTTTIDRDGSDLCLQPAFIPWLERILLHAAGRLAPRISYRLAAGMPAALPYREAVSVEGPGGLRLEWLPGTGAFVPPEPGIYRVLSGQVPVDAFAVGIQPSESDLRRLSPADLDARLGKNGYALGPGGTGATPSDAAGAVGHRDVSGRLAAVLLAALALEAVLSSRWARTSPKP